MYHLEKSIPPFQSLVASDLLGRVQAERPGSFDLGSHRGERLMEGNWHVKKESWRIFQSP